MSKPLFADIRDRVNKTSLDSRWSPDVDCVRLLEALDIAVESLKYYQETRQYPDHGVILSNFKSDDEANRALDRIRKLSEGK